ncbi:MAG TPA: hypothetical protein VK034_16635 [Enhygromyxa sp.]|nr:hypothetical protein [Enhygromyxa sp.]
MSATTSALIVTLVGALVSTATLVGPAPPPLPPEAAPVHEPAPDDGSPDDGSAERPEHPDGPVRSALPPGLQPVPFPLEHQRRDPPPTSDDPNAVPPPPPRRSIVDLRDPFDRPPPQRRAEGERDPTARLLLPDLKDPFAPGVRRVRSKTLDQRVPNDIRDPFRSPQGSGDRPACVKTTHDGTVVQAPGKKKVPAGDCQPPRLDLRDPFDRDAAR